MTTDQIPPAFLSRMRSLLGDEFPAFAEVINQEPLTGLRVNLLKLSSSEFQVISPFHLSPVSWCPSGFSLSGWSVDRTTTNLPPGRHPYHAAGLYYLQDPSAMAAAQFLAPQPGERILDLAAAPGGKTTHLAALMDHQGLLIANEIHPGRVWDLAQNLERCGVRNAAIVNSRPDQLATHFGAFFDRVLLDAPCSGEGMFRKSLSARQDWKPELVHSCALRQSAILSSAAQLVRPGGWLAYTTCTFAPEENEQVLDVFLNAHPEYNLLELPAQNGLASARSDWVSPPSKFPLNRALRLWPHRLQGEGHFIAVLIKSPNAGSPQPLSRSFTSRPPDPVSLDLFQTFWRQTMLGQPPGGMLHQSGSYLYLLPDGLPDLGGLKYIHPGWWLGVLRKGRFEPAHALALGMRNAQAQRVVKLSLDDPQIAAYLHGSSLPSPGENGWCLVTVDNYPLGWGKRSHATLKNAYPHGLRLKS